MPKLRKPTDSHGSVAELMYALRDLHLVAGEPSVRAIAKRTRALSHDTVHRVLTRGTVPRWGPLELVVEALDGDVHRFRELWIDARRAADDGQ